MPVNQLPLPNHTKDHVMGMRIINNKAPREYDRYLALLSPRQVQDFFCLWSIKLPAATLVLNGKLTCQTSLRKDLSAPY